MFFILLRISCNSEVMEKPTCFVDASQVSLAGSGTSLMVEDLGRARLPILGTANSNTEPQRNLALCSGRLSPNGRTFAWMRRFAAMVTEVVASF